MRKLFAFALLTLVVSLSFALPAQAVGKPGASTGILGTPPPSNEKKWALIIGIADYAPEGPEGSDLVYTDDDALDMNRTLVEKYGYLVDHIILLINSSATKEWILGNITLLKEYAQAGHEVVFFFSGHGTKEKDESGIVPHDLEVIWDSELAMAFSDFATDRICFIIESCYSGGMDGVAAPGRIVNMSSKGLSVEGDQWQNSQFIYYFVEEGMYQSMADANGDGLVTVEEAFDYAQSNCKMVNRPAINDQFENDMLL